MEKIKLHFKKHYNSIIWKQCLDASTNRLALELRDGMQKSMEISVLDLNSKAEILQFEIEEDAWLYSIWGICGNTLLLQKLVQEDSPEIEGVVVYDMAEGDFIWDKAGVTFISVQKETVLVQNVKNANEQIYLNLENGNEASPTKETHAAEYIERPSLYHENEEHFSTVAAYISLKYQIKPVSVMEYMETTGLVIISYYIYLEKKLVNMLLVMDKEGNELLNHIIEPEAKGVGYETFYLYNQMLFYIENKTDISVLSIN